MSVDTKLLQEFLSSIIPDGAKPAVNQAFSEIKENPQKYVAWGMDTISNHINAPDREESIACINGLMMGMWMAKISEVPDGAQFFKNWLEAYKRSKGEHVIDFSTAKARRP